MPAKTRAQLLIEIGAQRRRTRALERRLAAVAEREGGYRMLVEHAVDVVLICALDGTILDVNRAAEAISGWSRQELVGRSVAKMLTPASFVLGQERVRRSLAGERLPKLFELAALRKDGTVVPLEGWARFILDRRNRPTAHLGVYRDVSERQQAEAALRVSEERYRAVFERATDAIATFDLEGRFTSANPALERLTGFGPDELPGLHYTRMLTPASAVAAEERSRRALAGEKLSPIFEVEVLRKDGAIVPVEAHTRWIRDAQGGPVGFQGVYRDVTERRQVQEALRESEERYRKLFENANDPIATLSLEGITLSVNRALERSFGYAREQLIGSHYAKFVTPATHAEWLERTRRVVAGEKLSDIAEVEVVRADGVIIPAEVRGSIIRDKEGRPALFQAIFREIAERKLAEQALRTSEELHRTLFQEAEQARRVLDRLYRLALAMQASREPADRLRAFIEGAHEVVGFDRVYVLLVSEDGAALEMAASYGAEDTEPASRLPCSPAAGPFWDVLQTRRPLIVHDDASLRAITLLAPPYRSQRWFHSNRFVLVPLLAGDRVLGIVCADNKHTRRPILKASVEPFTLLGHQLATALEEARLFRELEDKSLQLEVANRHKSEFLAHMSHELRSPLNAIIGFSEVLLERMFGELNAKQAEYVDDVLTSGRHLLSLINDILDLSKVEAGRMELELARFSISDALQNVLTLVRERAMNHGIDVQLAVAPGVGDLVADERKIKQIVLNLLSNAVKFTSEGGHVTLAARPVPGGTEIAVSDTGIGIAPEDQEVIFEEFRQVGRDAARRSEGTGLGLALVRKLATLHGGAVRVASELGRGSTFTVTLPSREA